MQITIFILSLKLCDSAFKILDCSRRASAGAAGRVFQALAMTGVRLKPILGQKADDRAASAADGDAGDDIPAASGGNACADSSAQNG